VFSPDGRTLAYLAMRRPGYEADRRRIVLRPWPDGSSRVLAPEWDRSPGAIAWSPDGKTIYASAHHLGQQPLFAIDVAAGKVAMPVGEGTVHGFARTEDAIVYELDHLRSPVEIHVARPDGSGARRITRFNDEALARVRMGEPEQLTFAGWNGETVYAWLTKPVDFEQSRKYPVAFLIHGGPQGSFSNNFHYRWNPQAYAGAGYAALMVDFHGSTGYGQKFSDAIRGDWGGKPLVDLQKGLAAALERYPFLDRDRKCALGASYGGYMVNWIAGKWPDGFDCLVSHDGNLDERLAYFDTEELWFPEWDHEGTPWLNPEGYEKHNPILHVANWKTPMLVIHGGLDYRVVDTQGMSTFTAAQRQGIPSRFLYFPDENHWVLKPHNSILWHETVLDWLGRWTK
jgi:dipeptidyl aminopeptidase/acylaminoacyl peptidase